MPSRRSTPTGYQKARNLRKELTPAESKLWAYLRGCKINRVYFRRQHAIGKFVTDFCALKARLIIEVDGSQHIDQEEYDSERTEFLESKGFRVLRFWNSDVMNKIDDVMRAILENLGKSST